MTIHDTPDWVSPGGQGPAQVIGDAVLAFGTLMLGEDPNGAAQPIQVDLSGRVLTAGGGAAVGAYVDHAAPFDYTTPGLNSGFPLVFNDGYLPEIGDWIVDGWIEIDSAWNQIVGSEPLGDIGHFIASHSGWFQAMIGSPVLMYEGDRQGIPFGSEHTVQYGSTISGLVAASTIASVIQMLEATGPSFPSLLGYIPGMQPSGTRYFPAKLLTSDPIQVVVSTTGDNLGSNPGWSQGQGVVHIVTATPA